MAEVFGYTVFARYALPSDDLLATLDPAISTAGSPGAEDPDYPLTNWAFQKPSKPAKFLDPSAEILFDFGSPVNVDAFALIYHNIDPGSTVTISWGSTTAASTGSQSLTIDPWDEAGWPFNPWELIPNSPTFRYWKLEVSGSSEPLVIGRPFFVGALRDLHNDVRYGVEETEAHPDIMHPSQLGDETFYRLGNKRRAFSGEFALRDEAPYEHAQELISLHRSAYGRVRPWLLIPNVDVNDAWMVRFVDPLWSRTREMINHNIFPFRVRELARGWPWPSPGA